VNNTHIEDDRNHSKQHLEIQDNEVIKEPSICVVFPSKRSVMETEDKAKMLAELEAKEKEVTEELAMLERQAKIARMQRKIKMMKEDKLPERIKTVSDLVGRIQEHTDGHLRGDLTDAQAKLALNGDGKILQAAQLMISYHRLHKGRSVVPDMKLLGDETKSEPSNE